MSNFCKFLDNQVRIEYGQLRPCCWFTSSVNVFDKEKTQQFLTDIESITDWNSAKGRCSECYMRESKGLFSPRLQSFERNTFKTASGNSKVSVEIQIDKDCNGACLICGPWNSTTWEKYNNKIQNIPVQDISDHKSNTRNYARHIMSSVDLSTAQEILFLGGEPLKTTSHLDFLRLFDKPSEVVVKYTTNGSYKPDDETLEVWSKFKRILVQVSLDAVSEQFNYLRWPLQWHQVEDNIKFILDKPIDNITINGFSYTTTPFSLFYHDRYVEWANTLFDDGDFMFGRPWQPRGQTPMSLSATPVALQQAIVKKYGADHVISKLLEPFDQASHAYFMQFITSHDEHRKLNWREVFPEIVEYWKF